jgi:hypothetical protein
MMGELDVCLQLFFDWLAERHGRAFSVERGDDPEPDVLAASASDGALRLGVEVRALLDPTKDEPWRSQRQLLETDIAAGLEGAYALWLPPGAGLPYEAAEAEPFVALTRETASALRPGERSYVPLPAPVFIKKTQDDGALMSVSGGLNRYWASLSEGITGTFDVDSRALHRLPESEEHVAALKEEVREAARGIEDKSIWVELETIDAWTLQRLRAGEGVRIVGRPPAETADVGLAVRKNFRKLLASSAPRLRESPAGVKALVVVGFYGRMEDEGATTAMRGYDPALYSGLDFVCLAADGVIKPLMEAGSAALR